MLPSGVQVPKITGGRTITRTEHTSRSIQGASTLRSTGEPLDYTSRNVKWFVTESRRLIFYFHSGNIVGDAQPLPMCFCTTLAKEDFETGPFLYFNIMYNNNNNTLLFV